jgi:PTS system nitrogen regulatory IIA component
MNIFDISLIKTHIHANYKEDLLAMMVDDLCQQGVLVKSDDFLKTILDRESILSTGIGYGVAIPHSRHSDAISLKAVVYTLSAGINFDAIDGEPVRIVFMIAIPETKHCDYMKILSAISRALREEETRQSVIECKTPTELFRLIESW